MDPFVPQTCETIARSIKVFYLFPECKEGLFHKVTEWCIKYGAAKQLKNPFNLPNNAQIFCFDKLTGEHNNKNTLKIS